MHHRVVPYIVRPISRRWTKLKVWNDRNFVIFIQFSCTRRSVLSGFTRICDLIICRHLARNNLSANKWNVRRWLCCDCLRCAYRTHRFHPPFATSHRTYTLNASTCVLWAYVECILVIDGYQTNNKTKIAEKKPEANEWTRIALSVRITKLSAFRCISFHLSCAASANNIWLHCGRSDGMWNSMEKLDDYWLMLPDQDADVKSVSRTFFTAIPWGTFEISGEELLRFQEMKRKK